MIWFLGDVHGKFSHVLGLLDRAPLAERPKALVFLGDLDPSRPLSQEFRPFEAADIECWFIHGNHEGDNEESWRNTLDAWDKNISGRVQVIAGVRVAGLGGVFRGEVWYPDPANPHEQEPKFRNYSAYEKALREKQGIARRLEKLQRIRAEAIPERVSVLMDSTRNGQLRKHSSTIFTDTVSVLSQHRADVLVCHEAPSCHRNGFSVIDDLARTMRVQSVFHGHHHVDQTYPDAGESFKIFSVGYRSVRDIYGSLLLPSESSERSQDAMQGTGP